MNIRQEGSKIQRENPELLTILDYYARYRS